MISEFKFEPNFGRSTPEHFNRPSIYHKIVRSTGSGGLPSVHRGLALAVLMPFNRVGPVIGELGIEPGVQRCN